MSIKTPRYKGTPGIKFEGLAGLALDVSNTGTTPQPDVKGFIANALSGSIGVYWTDTNLTLTTGDSTNTANAGRSFFYIVKLADGDVKKTTPIPVGSKHTSVAYSAGTADVQTLTYTGTYTAGTSLVVRAQDITAGGNITPYPGLSWDIPLTGTIATDLATMRDKINNDKLNYLVTATSTSTTLVLTAKVIGYHFKVNSYIAGATGAEVITVTYTTKGKDPVGTQALIDDFILNYLNVTWGAINRPTGDGLFPSELGLPAWNIGTSGQYGQLILTENKVEYHSSATRAYNSKVYAIITVPQTVLAGLTAI